MNPGGRVRSAAGRRAAGALAVALGAAANAAALGAGLPSPADEPPVAEEAAAPAPPPPDGDPLVEPHHTPRPDDEPADPPTQWRSEVVELVRFVERERGLTFRHPVHVELLTEDEYRDEMGGQNDASLGFYDGNRVVVRGAELTPAVEGTLVHELTHVLDDQHFAIFDIYGRADVTYEELLAYDGLVEGDAIRIEYAYDQMLIDEGVDPAAVEDAPVPVQDPSADPAPDPSGTGSPGTSPPGTGPATTAPTPPTTVGKAPGLRRPAQSSSTCRSGASSAAFAPAAFAPAAAGSGAARGPVVGAAEPYGVEIPSLRQALDDSPYYIGEQLADVLVHEGGNAAVDAAFRDPPHTSEQVLDPRAYLAHEGARTVKDPDPAEADGPVEPAASLGAVHLYLVLAAGIDPAQALDAATGWGGDAAVSYLDAEGECCFALAAVGDTPADTAEIGEAFAAWTTTGVAAEASAAHRDDDGAHVLTACGLEDGTVTTDPLYALVLPAFRAVELWRAMTYEGLPAAGAFGVADCVVQAVPPATRLEALAADELSDGTLADLERAADGCTP